MEHCVNCGAKHDDINGYCKKCEERFRKSGMWDYIDERGFRCIGTGEACTFDSFVTLKDYRSWE